MNKISKFIGKYRFLSNFYVEFPIFVEYNGKRYRSVEHAFQSAKCVNESDKDLFLVIESPMDAKFFGKRVDLRPDWETIKLKVMEDCIRSKFKNKKLAKKLIDTGDSVLEEGNNWNDTFWGVCNGIGENNLGKILMKVRGELQNEVNS